jgi:hypothetical protein
VKKEKFYRSDPINKKWNVIKCPKLIADSFITYFLTITERMNNDITTITTAVPRTFPNINLMPTTANEIKYNKFLPIKKV